jgi:RNA polymerase sigma factor (sigma-70 family)
VIFNHPIHQPLKETLISDQEILEKFKDANSREEALRLLLRQYQQPIYYHVRRMLLSHDDADDVTQTTFINAWKGLSFFRGESKLSTWLYRIAYNECLQFISRKKKLMNVPLTEVQSKMQTVLQEDELFSGDEMSARLHSAVAALPEKQKAVFILKYFEDKKYEEIADITGTSVGALKASYHHAVKKIEEQLANVKLS